MIYNTKRDSTDYAGTATTYAEAIELRETMLKTYAMFHPDANRPRSRIRARLGRGNPYAHLYASGRGKSPRGDLHRHTSMDIRPEHGIRFDVYIRER